jgi:hypothetical protein
MVVAARAVKDWATFVTPYLKQVVLPPPLPPPPPPPPPPGPTAQNLKVVERFATFVGYGCTQREATQAVGVHARR